MMFYADITESYWDTMEWAAGLSGSVMRLHYKPSFIIY